LNIDNRKRPTVVCLCGSTRFADAYRDALRNETLAGKIVLSVGLLGHQEGLDMDGPVKTMLDVLHLRKIDLADEIFVLDVNGYIGQSTAREIAYAQSTGKSVRYLVGNHKYREALLLNTPALASPPAGPRAGEEGSVSPQGAFAEG
jgi:hypothetical protein